MRKQLKRVAYTYCLISHLPLITHYSFCPTYISMELPHQSHYALLIANSRHPVVSGAFDPLNNHLLKAFPLFAYKTLFTPHSLPDCFVWIFSGPSVRPSSVFPQNIRVSQKPTSFLSHSIHFPYRWHSCSGLCQGLLKSIFVTWISPEFLTHISTASWKSLNISFVHRTIDTKDRMYCLPSKYPHTNYQFVLAILSNGVTIHQTTVGTWTLKLSYNFDSYNNQALFTLCPIYLSNPSNSSLAATYASVQPTAPRLNSYNILSPMAPPPNHPSCCQQCAFS